jgi:hypothetical protein
MQTHERRRVQTARALDSHMQREDTRETHGRRGATDCTAHAPLSALANEKSACTRTHTQRRKYMQRMSGAGNRLHALSTRTCKETSTLRRMLRCRRGAARDPTRPGAARPAPRGASAQLLAGARPHHRLTTSQRRRGRTEAMTARNLDMRAHDTATESARRIPQTGKKTQRTQHKITTPKIAQPKVRECRIESITQRTRVTRQGW